VIKQGRKESGIVWQAGNGENAVHPRFEGRVR
jgi:hypothetical protein